MAGKPHRAHDVDIEKLLPGGIVNVEKVLGRKNAHVIDQDIRAGLLIYQRLAAFSGTEICSYAFYFAIGGGGIKRGDGLINPCLGAPCHDHMSASIGFEPGRAICANAGVLLTKVEFLKHTEHKNFAIIDAAMNDLMRPALYQAWQDIVPVTPRDGAAKDYDVVGAICETSDFLGKDRSLALEPNDLLAVRSAGAYGFVMSSNYNTRTRAAEVMVDGNRAHLVRQREELTSLWALESVLPE